MTTYEIRKSVGFMPKRHGNVWMYAVMVNGVTIAHFTSYDSARKYIKDRYGSVQIGK